MVSDIITYNALSSTCEKSKQPERAFQAFQRMKQQLAVPNSIMYSTLISACEKGQQLEQALDVLQAM